MEIPSAIGAKSQTVAEQVLENIDSLERPPPRAPQAARAVHYWRAEVLDGVEMLTADFTRHRFTRHWHAGYALGVVTRRAERFYCRGTHHVAAAGQLIAVNPGEIHDGEPAHDEGWSYRMLYPTERLVREIWTDGDEVRGGAPRFCQSVITDREIATELDEAHRTIEQADDRLEGEMRLLLVLRALLARHARADGRQASPAETDKRRLGPALELIEAEIAGDLSLAALAQAVGLGRFHFLRLFKASLGCPPHKYVVQRRVARAKTLLERGRSAMEAALEVGFFDQSHFANVFRQTYGVTPRAYQRGNWLRA
jgi:AraC-like DNA-binding protein